MSLVIVDGAGNQKQLASQEWGSQEYPGQIAMGVEYYWLVEGITFEYTTVKVLEQSSVSRSIFIAPNDIFILADLFVSSRLGLGFDFFEAPTYTGGTQVTPRNQNRNDLDNSGLIILAEPSVTDEGLALPPTGYYGGWSEGGDYLHDGLIFRKNTAYLAKLTSLAAQNQVQLGIRYREIEVLEDPTLRS